MGFARLGAPLELVGHRTGAPTLDAVAAYLIDGRPRWGGRVRSYLSRVDLA
jgi:hypothetical protein